MSEDCSNRLLKDFLVDFLGEHFHKRVSCDKFSPEFGDSACKICDAIFLGMVFASRVVALASLTSDQRETRVGVVVLKLVARHGHLMTLVAFDRLVCARLSVCHYVFEMKKDPAAVDAVLDHLWAVFLDV